MWVKFSGDEFLETVPQSRKRKKNSSPSVYVLHKTCHQEISRSSRAVTANKCTKKCNAPAECCFGYKTYRFFDVFDAVAVALLKLSTKLGGLRVFQVFSVVFAVGEKNIEAKSTGSIR